MKRACFAFAVLSIVALPSVVFAAEPSASPTPPAPPAPPKIEMVTLPRDVVIAVMRHQNSINDLLPQMNTPMVQHDFGVLNACLSDNPVKGVLMRQGEDPCPPVTAAFAEIQAEKDKAVANAVLAQKATDAKAATDKVAAPATTAAPSAASPTAPPQPAPEKP